MVVNDETSTTRSSPAVVVRGSAPQGTFQIPDNGLRFDSSDSFLSRFKSAIRLHTYPTTVSSNNNTDVPAKPSPDSSSSTSQTSTQSNTCLTETHVSTPHTASSPHTPPGSSTPVSSTPASQPRMDCAQSTRISTSHVIITRPSQAHLSERIGQSFPSDHQTGSTHNSKHISAEQAADEVEDTLIQVNPDGESLLNSNRHSYPILRFCSATALLHQSQLDKVVSCHTSFSSLDITYALIVSSALIFLT